MNTTQLLCLTVMQAWQRPSKLHYVFDFNKVIVMLLGLILAGYIVPAETAQHTSIATIKAAARQFIVTELGGGETLTDTNITVKPLDPRLRLAPCTAPLEVYKAPGTRLLGHSTVGVRCSAPQPWSLFVPVHIDKQVPVLTLRRTLTRGEILNAADLVVLKRSSAAIPVSYLRSSDDIIGHQAVRDIAPSVILTRSMFKPKKLIRRGDRVVLAMKSGLVAVRVAGIAMADGAKGQRIRVKNLSSKRVVDGTVSGEKVVLVDSAAIH